MDIRSIFVKTVGAQEHDNDVHLASDFDRAALALENGCKDKGSCGLETKNREKPTV
jgi:hypothetical protein